VYASTLGFSEDRENERACFVAFKGTIPPVSLFPSTDTETLKNPWVLKAGIEIEAALDICWKVTGASIKIAIS
jgi:hypothetical protein